MKKRILALAVVLALTGFAEEAAEVAPEEAVVESSQETPTSPAVKPVEVAPSPAPKAVQAPTTPVEAPAPTTTAETQTAPSSPWFFGIQLGQLRTNNSDQGRLEKVAYTAGALVEYHLFDQLFLQSELNYMNKGWRVSGTLVGDDVSLKYFEVPLFIKMKFPWNNVAPSLMAGPWIAYLHSATTTTNGISIDTTSATERFEYGVYVGAGLDLALSDELEMGLSARYGWGLSGLDVVTVQDAIHNRVIQLMTHLKFRL